MKKIVIDHKTVDRVKNPRVYGEIYDCDRCGFTWHKKELFRQDGLLVCEECYDEPPESKRRR